MIDSLLQPTTLERPNFFYMRPFMNDLSMLMNRIFDQLEGNSSKIDIVMNFISHSFKLFDHKIRIQLEGIYSSELRSI